MAKVYMSRWNGETVKQVEGEEMSEELAVLMYKQYMGCVPGAPSWASPVATRRGVRGKSQQVIYVSLPGTIHEDTCNFIWSG